jgi:hypothetical protein
MREKLCFFVPGGFEGFLVLVRGRTEERISLICGGELGKSSTFCGVLAFFDRFFGLVTG